MKQTVSAGSVDHSTIFDPLLEEDESSIESNKIPQLPPTQENTKRINGVPNSVPQEGDVPNEILLDTIGRESGQDVGIAYAEGGVTGKPSPPHITARSWEDITKDFLIWARQWF